MGELILMTLAGYEKLERDLKHLRNGNYTEVTHLLRDSLIDEEKTDTELSNDHPSFVEEHIQEIECLLACAVVVSSD